jgi:hypothetical protein
MGKCIRTKIIYFKQMLLIKAMLTIPLPVDANQVSTLLHGSDLCFPQTHVSAVMINIEILKGLFLLAWVRICIHFPFCGFMGPPSMLSMGSQTVDHNLL